MRNLLTAACLLAAAPATATGIEIAIAGDGADGLVVVDLFEEVAPRHAERITTLADDGAYDDVVFHRVCDGFMAQTGDVEYGVMGMDMRYAGTGGSDYPDLPLEIPDPPLSFQRGVVGMARTPEPASANSQFFIMTDLYTPLDGEYTVVGEVVAGMDVVDAIRIGEARQCAVIGQPDRMTAVTVLDEDGVAAAAAAAETEQAEMPAD